MKFTRNVKAISKLFLIILLLMATIVGAVLSYLWVLGYFVTLEIRVPKKTTVSITNATFNPQNTSYFNVTLLNPSYSPSTAKITQIVTSTGVGEEARIHNVTVGDPQLPYSLPKAKSATFKCLWNWANYTGETVKIIAFVTDASGPTFEAKAPLVKLEITDIRLNSTISITHFNMTIRNYNVSVTYVNITEIIADGEVLESGNVAPSLPHKLDPNSSVTLRCSWNWTNYQNASVTVAVRTLQGYMNYTTKVTPLPVTLEITEVDFHPANTTYFNVTVQNDKDSPTHVNITRITATMENGTVQEIDGTKVSPQIQPTPYSLRPNVTETFKCPWNWIRYWGKNVTVTVHTLQNFTMRYATATPSPIEIKNVTFDPAFTNQTTVTVNNSEFYPANVTITGITITVGNETFPINGTKVEPSLPYRLTPNSSIAFVCPWNWTNYQGKNVTIIVRSVENYTVRFTKVTSKRVILAITTVFFNPHDTTGFDLTVRNSDSSLEDANISKVTITLENGTIREIALSYTVSPNSIITFRCPWDWTNYRGKNITITVYTTKGYKTSTMYTTPSEP